MKNRNAALRVFAGILAVLLVAVPAVAQEKVDETRKLDSNGTLSIDNLSGSVEVVGWDKNEVQVTGTLGKGVKELRITGDSGRLEFETVFPDNAHDVGPTDLVFRVPRKCELDVETVSASIDVKGLEGEIELSSISGEITADGKASSLDVESVSGTVELTVQTDDLSVETVSGDVAISGATGEVEFESVSGDVGIDGEGLTSLQGETVSGDIEFEGRVEKEVEIELASHSGDVTLAFSGDVNARFDIATFSGDIENELKESARVSTSEWVKSMEMEFELGSGSGRVSIQTFSGDVELRKK